jgi:hypothetical protein
MKQILHIFAKDSRHFWPEILISLALLGTFVWIEPSTWEAQAGLYAVAGGGFLTSEMELGFLAGLLPLFITMSWWLLIARVTHAEALVGDRQFWVTRPYEWKKLLGAKAVFLVVFLYLPLLAAQCLLLFLADFHPLGFMPGLLFKLLLLTVGFILPLLAITTVTATFARLTMTLLALLACFAGYVAIALHFSDDAGVPFGDRVSMALTVCLCGAVIVLQYATRQVWLSRLLLIACPILLFLSAMALSDSTAVGREYPRASGGQEAPVQLALLQNAAHPPSAYLLRAKQVQVSIPLEVSGVAEGYAVITGPVKVTVDAGNGSHWTSPWQAFNNQQYLPGRGESGILVLMNRVFFDQVKATPVTLHFTIALTLVQAGKVISIPLPAQDFSVPDFGICSPQPDFLRRQFSGITCRFAMHQPKLTYITTHWTEGACPASQDPQSGVQGAAWIGSLESSPAEFGISPVLTQSINLSNETKGEGPSSEPRHLCPGTPVTFTQYNFAGKTQYDFTIPNFRLPSYQPIEGLHVGAGSLSFSVR